MVPIWVSVFVAVSSLAAFWMERLPVASETGRAQVTATTPMRIARMAHSATTLPNGRVLVAGGFTGDAHADVSAELFDGRSERFAPLPRMRLPRHSHTATLLESGQVLIVGGYGDGSTPTAAAELFDPRTNRFVSTGDLQAARAGHVAVRLRDGRVLVAGGVGPGWTFLASAEVYDPATGRFTPTGAMSVPRESHVAVRLLDDRVLVVGGHRGRRADIVIYTSAETYSTVTGTFTPVGELRVRRHKHDAVLLRDGRVLVTGGSDERDDAGAYRSTELFDASTGSFSMGPSLQRARYKHQGSSVLLPDGSVLLAGGAAVSERFDPVRGQFTAVPGDDALTGQFSAAAVLPDGRVLISGGYGAGRGPQALAWLYRP